MTNPVIQALVLKDLRMHRTLITSTIAGGAISLAILRFKSETAFTVGAVWFFVALILLGCMLPVGNVVNERKKQNLAFLMSLPVSATQYAMAKLVSTIGMYLVPWAALVTAASTFLLTRPEVPHGLIPVMFILFALPLVGFCVVAGAALISETEGWTIAATIVCNSSYGIGWYLIIRIPAINGNLKSPVPVWNSPALMILGGEIAAIVLMLGLTVYMQSRKRDFV
jgi:ABC-2 type transport system permease protein